MVCEELTAVLGLLDPGADLVDDCDDLDVAGDVGGNLDVESGDRGDGVRDLAGEAQVENTCVGAGPSRGSAGVVYGPADLLDRVLHGRGPGTLEALLDGLSGLFALVDSATAPLPLA